ncbi:MAG: outer membrane beta-barrel protein [Bacteroidaceae bacterium]|nr:outer membrane beta-barrel protein [Bacteroidaceae bacterium]
MKKMILTALVAVASLTVSAQIWVGGEVGFNTWKESNPSLKGNHFTVAPEIGYKLNDNLDVAVLIGYAHAKNGSDLFNFEIPAFENANGFELNPYLRYTFVKAGNFGFFVDGGFTYALLHMCGDNRSINAWELGLKPGISYGLSDKVTLVAHVGFAGYQYAKHHDWKRNEFGLGLDGNNISFGCYVNL